MFYSPIAWVVTLIFTFQTGQVFVNALGIYEKAVFLGRNNLKNFTNLIFNDPGVGLFPSVEGYLYLYIPLLTMGLISKELSSGSIKLLLSSPVKNREIVLGKFVSMMVFGMILLSLLLLFVLIASFIIPSMDVKMVFAGLLGFYLLICTYAAIGLFFSSLSSYQVIVAISTLVVLAMLNYIGHVGQKIDFVRDLTYFLSIAGRADEFRFGLISSKDVLYFLIVMVIFLGLTIIRLHAGRESRPWYVKAGRYAILMVSTLLLGYISSRPALSFYYDATATKQETLTAASQKVIGKIDKPVRITTYVNLLDNYHSFYGMPERRNEDMSRFEQYQRFLPGMEMRYVYYYDKGPGKTIYKRNPGLNDEKLARKIAASDDDDFNMFLSPAQMKQVIDLRDEDYTFVRQVEYGGRKTFLRIYNDNIMFPSEQEITAALSRLVGKPPVIGFISGDGERSLETRRDDSYYAVTRAKSFRYALINQGFDVVDVPAGAPVPDSLSALVLADPAAPLSQGTLNKIGQYIDQGGNMLIAGDTARQAIINPVLRGLGVEMMPGVLTEISRDFVPQLIFTQLTPEADKLDKSFLKTSEDSLKITMLGAASLKYDKAGKFEVKPFLTYRDTISLALTLTREVGNKQQRILVASDADFMSIGELGRFHTGNAGLYLGVFRWLSNSPFPVDVSRPDTPDNRLVITRDQVSGLRIVLLYILPGLILIVCALLLIRRKKR